jgi:hypothetical protein
MGILKHNMQPNQQQNKTKQNKTKTKESHPGKASKRRGLSNPPHFASCFQKEKEEVEEEQRGNICTVNAGVQLSSSNQKSRCWWKASIKFV